MRPGIPVRVARRPGAVRSDPSSCLQVEGCFPDTMTKCAELINQNAEVDFVDINSGCPIDLIYKKVSPDVPSEDSGRF